MMDCCGVGGGLMSGNTQNNGPHRSAPSLVVVRGSWHASQLIDAQLEANLPIEHFLPGVIGWWGKCVGGSVEQRWRSDSITFLNLGVKYVRF
jgi:hypothetical protein